MKVTKAGMFGALGFVLVLSAPCFADGYPGRGWDHGDQLERRVEQLERRVDEMSYSIRRLEERLDSLTPPAPIAQPISACMLIESGFSKVYLGIGATRIDAEYSARQDCQSHNSPVFCGDNAQVKCDDNRAAPYLSHSCMITDSGFGKTYRGQGRTFVEAEAKAKQACQNDGNAVFCAKVVARCQ